MTMSDNNYASKLDFLFVEWQQRMRANGEVYYDEKGELAFTKDGIVYKNGEENEQTEQNWTNSSKRILFLLKDQHQKREEGESFWSEDIRYWIKDVETDTDRALKQKRENRELGNRFFKHLAYIFWGLSKAETQNSWEFEEVIKNEHQVKKYFNTQPFAFVECKKQPGDGKLDNKALQRHLNDYGDLLKREIEILNPNMIVCTSTYIYKFVQKMYNGELKTIEGHNSIRFHSNSGNLVFCSYHPSAFRGYSGKANYDSVMNHYRAFLKIKEL